MRRRNRWIVVAVAGWAVAALAVAQRPTVDPARGSVVAEVKIDRDSVTFAPAGRYRVLELTVSGPAGDDVRRFDGSEKMVLELARKDRSRMPDGVYQWELRAQPVVPDELAEKMSAAREAADRGVEVEIPELEKLLDGPFYQAGSFAIREGALVTPDEVEPEPRPGPREPRRIEGDLEVAGDLEVRGRKSFVAPGTPAGGQIVYVALEGPEAGTYLRGSAVTVAGEAVIELPEHFARVTEAEGLTVQLTPSGGWSRLYLAEKSPARLVVRDAGGGDAVAFDYLVQGVRSGYGDFDPVRDEESSDDDR